MNVFLKAGETPETPSPLNNLAQGFDSFHPFIFLPEEPGMKIYEPFLASNIEPFWTIIVIIIQPLGMNHDEPL